MDAGVFINDGKGGFQPCPPAAGRRGLTKKALHPLATPGPKRYSAPHATSTFDTHAFVKRLTKAGMSEDQAKVLSKGQADLYERLVTKEYFEFTLKHELEKLRAELKNDIDKVQTNLEQVKAELKNDIEKVRAELKLDIEKLRADLEQKFSQQEAAIREMEQKLTIKLGSIVVIGITVLSVLDKLF